MFQSLRQNQNEHSMFHNFFPENRAFSDIMCKNAVQPDRPQMKIS